MTSLTFSVFDFQVFCAFCHFDLIMTSYLNIFEFGLKTPKYPSLPKFELDQVIIFQIIEVSLFFHPKK